MEVNRSYLVEENNRLRTVAMRAVVIAFLFGFISGAVLFSL